MVIMQAVLKTNSFRSSKFESRKQFFKYLTEMAEWKGKCCGPPSLKRKGTKMSQREFTSVGHIVWVSKYRSVPGLGASDASRHCQCACVSITITSKPVSRKEESSCTSRVSSSFNKLGVELVERHLDFQRAAFHVQFTVEGNELSLNSVWYH